jgi:quercetin dioxygenase-like cupin family protein
MSVSLPRVSLYHVADVLISAARPHRVLVALVALAAGAFACRDTTTPKDVSKAVPIGASETMGVGFNSTLIGRGNLGTFNLKCKADGNDAEGESQGNTDHKSIATGYCAELRSRDNTDIAVANISVAVGGSSGWHYHPGPVLVVVKTGTITFYRADDPNCAGTRYSAGTTFTEAGGAVGNARNEGAVEVTSVATFFAPPGAALRIDAAKPENCA